MNHLTDRYVTAVNLLGDNRGELQIGGIFALEALARDSPPHGSTIAEVLTAFIRGHGAALDPSDTSLEPDPKVHAAAYPEVAAALKVLSRTGLVPPNGVRLDIRGANLSRIELGGGVLDRARLHECDLSRASMLGVSLQGVVSDRADWRLSTLAQCDLSGARFDGSRMCGASLRGARLAGALIRHSDLRAANLQSAQLEGADFRGSVLRGARLEGATMKGATLTNVDLTGAVLVGATLTGAVFNGTRVTGTYLSKGAVEAGQLNDALDVTTINWV